MKLSELFPPEAFKMHLAIRNATIEEGKPIIFSARLTDVAVEWLHSEVVHLPVFAPDRTSKWVLTGIFYCS